MSNLNKVLDRIQKLLRLKNNAGTEAEAALAAERARQLMAQYEIQEAMISLENPTEMRRPEPIAQVFEVTKTKKKVAWHMNIASAVAKSYGARVYWWGGSIKMFGRLSTVQAANYTTHYLLKEVERITDQQAPTSSFSKSYRNSFRLGCASRVAERIREQSKAKVVAAPMGFSGDGWDAEDVAEAAKAAPEVNPLALAVIEKDRQEVEDAYNRFSSNFDTASNVGNYSNGGGYAAGKAAGNSANLGGSARGGLKAGQGSLK